MIVSGAVGIVYNVFGILRKMSKRNEEEGSEERPGTFTSVCSCVFGCFLLAWFIAGNNFAISDKVILIIMMNEKENC
jgi:hypothetical protein